MMKKAIKKQLPFFVKHKHMRWLLPLLVFLFVLLLVLPKKESLSSNVMDNFGTSQEMDKANLHTCDNSTCTIEELGIIFNTPRELSDLVYMIDMNHMRVTFTTKSLLAKDEDCVPGSLGTLTRYEKSHLPEDINLTKLSGDEYKEFDDFIVLLTGPGAVCSESSDTDEINDYQLSQFQLMKQVPKSIELYKNPSVSIFLNNKETSEKVNLLIKEIHDIKGVKKVTYISKKEALEIYKKQIADDPVLLEYITEDVLPSSINVEVDASIEIQNDVEKITKDKDFVDKVIKSLVKKNY